MAPKSHPPVWSTTMKVLTAISILTAILLLSATPIHASDPINDTLKSIVMISYPDPDSPFGDVCTAFVVSASMGQALTARHCIPESGAVQIDGQESNMVKENQEFALVEVPVMSKPPLSIRKDKAKVGEEVVVLGYGWGKMMVLTRHVAAYVDGDIILDGPMAPGMSGGPIVDMDGKLVGITQGANSIVGVGCGTEEIIAFLKGK